MGIKELFKETIKKGRQKDSQFLFYRYVWLLLIASLIIFTVFVLSLGYFLWPIEKGVLVLNNFFQYFDTLTDFLNKQIHPSSVYFEEIFEEDFSVFITDSFNKNLAVSLLEKIDKAMGVVYLIFITHFNKILKYLENYKFVEEWEKYSPITYSFLIKKQQKT